MSCLICLWYPPSILTQTHILFPNERSAEQLVSEEIELVQEEAEGILEGFSKQIWPMAMQLRQALMQKQQQEEAAQNADPAAKKDS